MVLYQVCSNEGPGVQDGPLPEGLRCEPLKYIEKYKKNPLLQNHLAQILEIGYKALPSGPLPSLSK